MMAEQQEARPRIAEVLRRFDVDECCNQEIILHFKIAHAHGHDG